MTRFVLLDSDIGNHVDDAFAMAAVCSAPGVRLAGVTTTGENAALRAVLARRLLDAYGAGAVPVASGSPPPSQTVPLRGRTLSLAKEWADEARGAVESSAVELMRRAIDEHPGLTVIATAPLTNVAALIRRHPEAARSIGRIIFMGGWSVQALPEYNLRADPEAVQVVLGSGVPLTSVGYEVTLRCALKRPHLRQLESARGDGPRLLYTFYQSWREQAPSVAPIMHDPLTVAALSRPDLVEIAQVPLKVVLDEGPGRGTLYRAVDGRPVDVCTAVDPGAYLTWLMQLVAPEPAQPAAGPVDPSTWRVQVKEAYHIAHYAGWSNAADTGEHHVVLLVTEGEGRLELEGESYRLAPGTAAYLPAGVAYRLQTAAGMKSYWFHFAFQVATGSTQVEFRRRIPELQLFYPEHARTPMLLAQAERILRHWLDPWLEGHLLCQASLLELLAHLLYMKQEAAKGAPDDVVVRAQRYIHARARQHLTLEELSRHVNVSKFHLARLFRDAYGVPPLEYHTRLRMEHAKRLLSLGTMPVSAVAAQLGYASRQAFSRAFHRETGVPPSEYRE